ncbi:hypothetical protein [Serinibacter salmoneus]|uniref:Uncharacterized protein n=1 Tax=Serinibacter salmoneus TaxID=556530 RepID=A0A2A9CZD6_9MICO|nr:hypothetical protein [Serinibacter salmoneus]PFG19808.1 hypothetical protein ATL40_1379 [Serinibacter salmoneus]
MSTVARSTSQVREVDGAAGAGEQCVTAFAFTVEGISYGGTTPWMIVLTTCVSALVASTSDGSCSSA